MKEKLSKLDGNYNSSRIMALVLSLLLCISVIGIIASAASVTKDGIEATLTTDKEEYSTSEPIVATLTVENKGDRIIDEVNLETLIPEGYHIESSSTATKNVGQIGIGEKAVLAVTLLPNSNTTPETPVTPGTVTPETPSKNDDRFSGTDEDNQNNEQGSNSISSSTKSTNQEKESSRSTAASTRSTVLTTPSVSKNMRATSNSDEGTSTNFSSKTVAKAAYTGDDNMLWIWSAIACLSLALLLFVNRNKRSGFLNTLYSVILVFAILGTIANHSFLKVSAEDSSNTIELETNVAVGNEPITINSIVKYSMQLGQLDAYSTCQSDEIYYSTTTFDDMVAKDAGSAKRVIGTKSTEIGIEDIENELRLKDEPQTATSKFYRFSQYFKSVPVFGRQVILKTDDNGKVQALVSNTHHIENVEDEGSLSQSEIQMIIEEEMKTPNARITDEGCQTVIYDYGEDGPIYAYLLTVVSDISFNQLIIDKKSGVVLQNSPILKHEDVMLYNQTGALKTLGWHDELGFHLTNKQKNISVFDGSTVLNGSPWKVPENGVNTDFGTYGLRIITHDENVFGNEEIGIVNDILYFSNYYSALGGQDFDQIHVALNVNYDNASGGGGIEAGKKKAIMMIGSSYSATMYDVIAHEYTHAVQGTIVGLNGNYNNKMPDAINEGIADIFGTLIESKIKDKSPDWIMGEDKDETTRNIANPTSGQSIECAFELLGKNCPIKAKEGKHVYNKNYKVSNNTCLIKLPYPDKYMGKNYYENRDEHPNSLVISHAAYLMWNGINGVAQKKIPEDELAQIWYDSLYLMNSDATFMQCANAVYLAAKNNGNLSEEQIGCVKEAFDAVGLNYKGEYRVGKGSPFNVKNHQGDNLASFYLTIENGNGDVVSAKQYTADQAYINLDDGKYLFKVKKTESDVDEYEFAINVSGLETFTLNLHTLIEGQNGAFSIEGIGDPEPSQDNNGHYYKVFDDDLTWDEAKSICESYGGHLVTITSQKENNLVSNLIKDGSMGAYWIGAQRDDEWKWITGEDFIYSSWQPNRPDDNEFGMVIQLFNDNVYENQLGLWDDTWTDGDHAAGLREQGYVCEWDSEASYQAFLQRQPNAYEINMESSIEIDGKMETLTEQSFILDGHRYQLYQSYMKYLDTEQYLEDRNCHLATFSSKAENDSVSQYTRKYTDFVYIGLSDYKTENSWEWVDGTPLLFENWVPGEPNNEGNREDWAGLRSDGLWNDGKWDYDVRQSRPIHILVEWDSVT